jgi:hypothetical protein
MEESAKQLWTFCLWYAGISTTITAGLFGWLVNLTNRIGTKENLHEDLIILKDDLREIKVALIGSYTQKGLLTKYHELEDRVTELEGRT